MKHVTCNLCGSPDSEVLFTRGDLSLGLGGLFTVVQCSHCSLVYQNPQPTLDELFTIYYPAGYDQYITSVYETRGWLQRRDRSHGLHKRCRAVNDFHPTRGRILDVGCSTGYFLHTISQYGWEIQGVEPGREAADYASTQLGVPVLNGTLFDARFDRSTFDVVTLWDVIEHVPDPAGNLREINRILKPGGLLVIATPQLDSLDARLFGRFWIGYELPRHLTIFSRQTLTEMAGGAGFDLLERRCFYGSYLAFYSSVRFWLRSFMRPSWLRTNVEALMFSRPMRLIQAPVFTATDWLKQSSTITSFFRRQ